jgi:hypothetical protein
LLTEQSYPYGSVILYVVFISIFYMTKPRMHFYINPVEDGGSFETKHVESMFPDKTIYVFVIHEYNRIFGIMNKIFKARNMNDIKFYFS